MDVLEIARLGLRYLHLLGMALLVGGLAVQLLARQLRINTAMVIGVVTQLVTGILLAAPLGRDEQPDPAKLGIKLLLGLLLAVMVIVPRNRERVAAGHFYAIASLSVLTVAVATFWT